MTSEEPKKEFSLSEEDYANAKPWKFDEASLIRRVEDLGGPYEGILEGYQNALDSPIDRLKDHNRIDITIPCLGDPDYGKYVLKIADQGGSITKDYGGDIVAYINSTKAISKKPNHRFGMGIVQYFNTSIFVIQISMDDKCIYKVPIMKMPDGRPAYGKWSFDWITPENKEKYGIFEKGTITYFCGKIENVPDFDPTRVGKEIKQIFGWRMFEQENTETYINDIKLDLPDELKGKKSNWICQLKRQKVEQKDGTVIQVDPVVYGFIEADPKGTGHLLVYADGGYFYDKVKFANKRFSGTIYIDALPLDSSRRRITHEAMWFDLQIHMIKETKHFKDIPTDSGDLSKKDTKNIKNYLNKILSKFDLQKLHIEKFRQEQKKRLEILDGNTSLDDTIGTRVREKGVKKPIELCELCGHRMVKNTRGERKGCECECHTPGTSHVHVGTVGGEGTGTDKVKIEIKESENKQKKSEFNVEMDGNPWDGDPIVDSTPDRLTIRLRHPLFIYYNMKKHIDNLNPYLAHMIMDLKYPDAFTTKSPTELRQLHEEIVRSMISD